MTRSWTAFSQKHTKDNNLDFADVCTNYFPPGLTVGGLFFSRPYKAASGSDIFIAYIEVVIVCFHANQVIVMGNKQ